MTKDAGFAVRTRQVARESMPWLRGWRATLFLAAVAVAGASAPAGAATFTVTNLNSDDVGGPGSLYQTVGDALAAGGDNTIVFAAGLNGTIGSAGLDGVPGPDIPDGNALTIDGDNRIALHGGNFVGFGVDPDASLTLKNLTVTHALGAIFNLGTVTLIHTTVSDNNPSTKSESGTPVGAAIDNEQGGTATVIDSTFSGNWAYSGGAIYNGPLSTLSVVDSTCTGNSATGTGFALWDGDGGGAIFNYEGIVTISNSTFSDNTAIPDPGSQVGNAGVGGAIYNFGAVDPGAVMTISNSTFSGNTADFYGGAIYNENTSGTTTVINSTINGNTDNYFLPNGGGIANRVGTFNLSNSLVANNVQNDCYGVVNDGGHNLVEDGSCVTVGSNGNISGDPMLGPLADNGGPTQTHALLAGSPALDAGDNAICAADPVNNLDQRGLARPQGAVCDIGAFEQEKSIFADGFEAQP